MTANIETVFSHSQVAIPVAEQQQVGIAMPLRDKSRILIMELFLLSLSGQLLKKI